jgi:hypothetical protein
MADYSSNPGPSEDMYESGGDAPEKKPAEGSDETEGAKGEGQTALVPESLCPGMKPGEEMVVRIKSVMDGQYEVEYSPEPDKKEEAPPEAPAKPPGDAEMASMME